MSYTRAIFNRLHQTGRMIMRPLYMDFGVSDPEIMNRTAINDNVTTQQYMFGPRILVTPVTLPNVTEWDVYLPQPANIAKNTSRPWTYWWTNQTYSSGQTVTVPTPLEHIPVFYLGSRDDIMSGNVF